MEYYVSSVRESDFTAAPKAEISCYKWGSSYSPRANASLIYVEDKGFALRMTAFEAAPKTTYYCYNDPVYKDSCLEFFVNFNPTGCDKYMNFEMNSSGAFLSALRADRHNKTPIDKLFALPKVTPFKGEGFWGVEAFFGLDFIYALFGKRVFRKGDSFKGNFYKCGDETEFPHFGMWSPVENETPDFHRPEYFGNFILE